MHKRAGPAAFCSAMLNRWRARLQKLTVATSHRPVQRCIHREVRSVDELFSAAAAAERTSPALLASCLRELAELNTPALLLNIVESQPRIRVVLRPRVARSIRFRGSCFLVHAGSATPTGTTQRSRAPDHPAHFISLEHHGDQVFTGDVPPWLTHFTLIVNGVAVTRAEPVIHERGAQVWAA